MKLAFNSVIIILSIMPTIELFPLRSTPNFHQCLFRRITHDANGMRRNRSELRITQESVQERPSIFDKAR
jgi:hypothetical protein